jgi:imidazolonepropionase-like amidohydrolase
LANAGVKVAIGSGGMDPAHTRDLPLLAAQLVGHGLERTKALAGVTTIAAEVLDVGARMGSIEVGKDADLVVWSAEPLTTAAQATYVVSAGRVVLAPEQN